MKSPKTWMAVDTMSGDHGPEPIVAGAVKAVKNLKVNVILVGSKDLLEKILARTYYDKSTIRVHHCNEFIGMTESPAIAIKQKKKSSVMECARLTRENEAIGFFSPGNTGATMGAALKVLGRIPGVARPGIATAIPRGDGRNTLVIDAGANVICKTFHIIQFAIMGDIYSREILKIQQPKIGLLSNAEEESKGTELTRTAFKKLVKLPLNIIGHVEGRDVLLLGKEVDVVVTDGFTGNILLKTVEGTALSIFEMLKINIKRSKMAMTGAILLKKTLNKIKNLMDYRSHGGAPLLGVNGVVIIGHGSSDEWAVYNGIRVATEFAQNDILNQIKNNIKQMSVFGF